MGSGPEADAAVSPPRVGLIASLGDSSLFRLAFRTGFERGRIPELNVRIRVAQDTASPARSPPDDNSAVPQKDQTSYGRT